MRVCRIVMLTLLSLACEPQYQVDLLAKTDSMLALATVRDSSPIAARTTSVAATLRLLGMHDSDSARLLVAREGIRWNAGELKGDTAFTFFSYGESGLGLLGVTYVREDNTSEWKLHWIGFLDE